VIEIFNRLQKLFGRPLTLVEIGSRTLVFVPSGGIKCFRLLTAVFTNNLQNLLLSVLLRANGLKTCYVVIFAMTLGICTQKIRKLIVKKRA
jgi:hypothetical protein